MLEILNNFCMMITSSLLDWLLYVPRDLVLLAVVLMTGLILILLRKICTNQDLLKRCKSDKRRLKEMIREAKRRKDKQAVTRHRMVIGQIDRKLLMAEPGPLLISVIPVVLLAVWCFARIAYQPINPGDPVTIKVYYPASGIGELTYLLPHDGVSVDKGLIREILEDHLEGTATNGIATWELKFDRRDKPYTLLLRHHGRQYDIKVSVDGKQYETPLVFYDDRGVIASEVVLQEYRPFGVVAGIDALILQPWIVGYLILVIPVSLLLKRILRVY